LKGQDVFDIQDMVGKEVKVIANGISYSGELVEITDSEVNLKTLMQWISLPVSTVNSIEIAGQIRKSSERGGILHE
jgi:hypothetical protein